MAIEASSAPQAPRAFGSVPGPRGWPLVGVAPHMRTESFHALLEEWARRYGSVFTFRIMRRRFLVVTDPEAIASVLRRRPGLFRRTRRLEQASREMGFLGLFSASGETWKRQRPMVLAGLDPAHIRTYLPAMSAVTERLRRRWVAAAAEERDIDLTADLMRYTVDVTTSLAFGHDLNTLDATSETAIQQHLNVILPALFKRLLSPIPMRPDRGLRRHIGALRAAVDGFIEQARRDLSQQPDLRQHPANLIQALVVASEGGQNNITPDDVAGNVLTMLLAGEDTTAHTLAWLFWFMHRHPDAMQRARRGGHGGGPRRTRAVGGGHCPPRHGGGLCE